VPLVVTASYIADSIALYRQYKTLADRAIAQVSDARLTEMLDPESNSIALIMKHLAGNLKSRWTDFFTTDGEKPDRDRDSEFERPPSSRAELLGLWEAAWRPLFSTLDALTDADLARTVTIRGEAHSVLQAINRNLTHCAYHVGQIVFVAKHFQSDRWQTLTIPKRR
jgi:hypothetical protein